MPWLTVNWTVRRSEQTSASPRELTPPLLEYTWADLLDHPVAMVVEVVEEAEETITTEEGTDTGDEEEDYVEESISQKIISGALLVHTIVADHRLQDQDTDTDQDPEATLLVSRNIFSNIQKLRYERWR